MKPKLKPGYVPKEIDMDKEREFLIKELKDTVAYENSNGTDIYLVADFIIADRRRIVEPLVEFNNSLHTSPSDFVVEARLAMDETFKLAGVE